MADEKPVAEISVGSIVLYRCVLYRVVEILETTKKALIENIDAINTVSVKKLTYVGRDTLSGLRPPRSKYFPNVSRQQPRRSKGYFDFADPFESAPSAPVDAVSTAGLIKDEVEELEKKKAQKPIERPAKQPASATKKLRTAAPKRTQAVPEPVEDDPVKLPKRTGEW